jgi:hypothetical protein
MHRSFIYPLQRHRSIGNGSMRDLDLLGFDRLWSRSKEVVGSWARMHMRWNPCRIKIDRCLRVSSPRRH